MRGLGHAKGASVGFGQSWGLAWERRRSQLNWKGGPKVRLWGWGSERAPSRGGGGWCYPRKWAEHALSSCLQWLSHGADSNGSGISVLLELARLFSRLYTYKRTHAA